MALRERARTEAQKEARAASILAAFRELVEERSYGEVTVAEVAARARMSKGTVFNYYATKESLGIALVRDRLSAWLTRVGDTLRGLSAPASPVVVARVVVESLREMPVLVSLLAILGEVLERNLADDEVRAFKLWLVERGGVTGRDLERVLPFLGEGGGLSLLLTLYALVIGLYQLAGPSPVVQRVLAQPSMKSLRVDFDAELERALRLHLEGLRATSRS